MSRVVAVFLAVAGCIFRLCGEAGAQTLIGSPSNGETTRDPRITSYPFTSHGTDYSIPNPVVLSWQLQGGGSGVTYDVRLSETEGLGSNEVIVAGTTNTTASVRNLKVGWRYYWKVMAWQGGTNIAGSSGWNFRTPFFTPRWLRIRGTTNFRDLGGAMTTEGNRIRQGLLFRSGELNFFTNSAGQHLVDPNCDDDLIAAGIRTELDVRGNAASVLSNAGIAYFTLEPDIGAYTNGLIQADSRLGYRQAFQCMAVATNLPLLFHCQGGADRTGTLGLLIESILGLSEEELCIDYENTSLSALYQQRRRDSTYYAFYPMLDYLRGFDPAGESLKAGAWNYLVSIGVTTQELAAIRLGMLEPVDGQTVAAIATNAVWKYRYAGSDPGATWKDFAYADSAWSNGIGALGYGLPSLKTPLSYGSDPNHKPITAYFRKAFVFEGDTNAVAGLMLRARYNDGIVAYLNGWEVARRWMVSGGGSA